MDSFTRVQMFRARFRGYGTVTATAVAVVGTTIISSKSWVEGTPEAASSATGIRTKSWKPLPQHAKLRVGVLGATGTVGQQFLKHLEEVIVVLRLC